MQDGDGKVVRQDSFGSRYIPEDAIYLVGKGGKMPAGQTLAGLYPGYTGSTTGIDLTHWLAAPKPHNGQDRRHGRRPGRPDRDGDTGAGGTTLRRPRRTRPGTGTTARRVAALYVLT